MRRRDPRGRAPRRRLPPTPLRLRVEAAVQDLVREGLLEAHGQGPDGLPLYRTTTRHLVLRELVEGRARTVEDLAAATARTRDEVEIALVELEADGCVTNDEAPGAGDATRGPGLAAG